MIPMNAIPSILTTVAILIHSVFGCCLHHSHDCRADHDQAVAQQAEDSHDDHDHGHCHSGSSDSSPDDEHDGNHEKHNKCDEGDCSVVTVARVNVKSQLLMAHSLPCATNDSVHCSLIAQRRSGARFEILPWQGAALPLHALTQVWLV